MKPQRMRMTHELVAVYDMLDKMQVLVRYKPVLLTLDALLIPSFWFCGSERNAPRAKT